MFRSGGQTSGVSIHDFRTQSKMHALIDKTPTHALFHIQHCISLKCKFPMLKYVKIFKFTPTCFDLNRSSSGLYLVKVTE